MKTNGPSIARIAKMSLDPKPVNLTADVFITVFIILLQNTARKLLTFYLVLLVFDYA